MPGFAHGSVHVGYVWTKWHWGRFFFKFFDFPVNIIPPWLSILIHHLGDEQQARKRLQFRDTVSPH
jgi:hypothetical protein